MGASEVLPSFENTRIAFSNKSDKELLQTYRLFKSFNIPILLKLGTGFTQLAFKLGIPVEGLIKRSLFKQFCGGETLVECEEPIKQLAQSGIKTILEFSVEAKSSESDYDEVSGEMLRAIEYASFNTHVKGISCKITGLGRFNLFEKVHRRDALTPEEVQAIARVKSRMDKICRKGVEANVGVYFDAEESWIQSALDELINDMMHKHNREKVIVFNTFQLYRTDRLEYLKNSFQAAKASGYLLGAKLVRGAYLEKERERAAVKKYPSPIHADKDAVDKAYNLALDFCIENGISLIAATHNEVSCLYLAKRLKDNYLESITMPVLFSQLYGMGENLTYNLAAQGLETTKLIPYGPVKEVIPYLIRRAEENSAMSGQLGREFTYLSNEVKRRGLK